MRMRWQTRWVCLLLAGLVSASAREAKAQYGEAPNNVNVYTNTYIYFDDENGVMYGEADAYTDYLYSVYYTISVYADLEGDNGDAAYGGNYDSGQGESHPGATAYAYLEAKADTNYTVTGTYDVTFGFEDEYDYFDYYNFQQYEFNDVHALDWYDFYGYFINNYPPYGGGTTNAHLASTHSNKRVNKPDHVRVIHDETTLSDCGGKFRHIWYKVVDSNGKGVGTVNAKEAFYLQANGYQIPSVYNSCDDSNIYPDPYNYEPFTNGVIKDGLYVGCGGDCGVSDFVDRWWAAKSDEWAVVTSIYSPHANEIRIRGTASSLAGQELY